MKSSHSISEKVQYRLVLCGHKAVEAAAVCLVLMVQGNLMAITLTHLSLASRTGLLAVFPAVGLTFTRYARHFANRWTSSLFFGVSTFLADSFIHPVALSQAPTPRPRSPASAPAFSQSRFPTRQSVSESTRSPKLFLFSHETEPAPEVQDAAMKRNRQNSNKRRPNRRLGNSLTRC